MTLLQVSSDGNSKTPDDTDVETKLDQPHPSDTLWF